MVNIHFSDLRSASESEAHHWIDGLTWRGDKRGGTKALGLSPNGTTLHLHLKTSLKVVVSCGIFSLSSLHTFTVQ